MRSTQTKLKGLKQTKGKEENINVRSFTKEKYCCWFGRVIVEAFLKQGNQC